MGIWVDFAFIVKNMLQWYSQTQKDSFCISWYTRTRSTPEYVLKNVFAESEIMYGSVLDQGSRTTVL